MMSFFNTHVIDDVHTAYTHNFLLHNLKDLLDPTKLICDAGTSTAG